jgi:hypothetical protein
MLRSVNVHITAVDHEGGISGHGFTGNNGNQHEALMQGLGAIVAMLTIEGMSDKAQAAFDDAALEGRAFAKRVGITIPGEPGGKAAETDPAPRELWKHTTQPGESVMGIALRNLGDEHRWREVADLNADRFPGMGPSDYYPVGTVVYLPIDGDTTQSR